MDRNKLMTEVGDSVSRIIDNIGFSEVTRGAHNQLVKILVATMMSTSGTLKHFMENADIPPSALSETDVLKVLKYKNVNIPELLDYVQQVRPFPPSPEKEDEEGEENQEELLDRGKENNIIIEPVQKEKVEKLCENINNNNNNVEEEKVKRKEIVNSTHTIPRFDDMDEIQLGFACYKPVPQPLVAQLIPARPMKRQPLSPSRIEVSVKNSRTSQSTPDVHTIVKINESEEFTDFVVPTLLDTAKSSKMVKKPRGSYNQRRMYLKKHESRLRQEQIEEQERMKQEKIEKEERSKQKLTETRKEEFKRKRERKAPKKRAVEVEVNKNGRFVMKIRRHLLERKIPKINIRFKKLSDDTMIIRGISTVGGRVRHVNVISKVIPRRKKSSIQPKPTKKRSKH